MRSLCGVAVAILAVAFGGCAQQAREYGGQLFRDPHFSDSLFNEVSCATCHDTSEARSPDRMTSGHTMWNVTTRPLYWGGREHRLIDAVSFCYVYFMRGAGPIDPQAPANKALYEYLRSLGDGAPAPTLPLTLVEDVTDLPAGDAGRGERVYRTACQECHGAPHTGAGRHVELAPPLPDEVQGHFTHLFPGTSPRLLFIEKVRHGQFFGVGGLMPLYGLEMMSNEELSDLLAFLAL